MKRTVLILGLAVALFALGCARNHGLAETWRLLQDRRSSVTRLGDTVRLLKRSRNGMTSTFRLLKNSGEGMASVYRTLFHGFLGPYSWDELYMTGSLLKRQ